MNAIEPKVQESPSRDFRPIDWSTDGIAMTNDGMLVIREGPEDGSILIRSAPPAVWLSVMAQHYEIEGKLRDAEMRVNAREPDRFLQHAIDDLEQKANEAALMRGDGLAGKIMWGQAQAYRDAIAHLKTFFK